MRGVLCRVAAVRSLPACCCLMKCIRVGVQRDGCCRPVRFTRKGKGRDGCSREMVALAVDWHITLIDFTLFSAVLTAAGLLCESGVSILLRRILLIYVVSATTQLTV